MLQRSQSVVSNNFCNRIPVKAVQMKLARSVLKLARSVMKLPTRAISTRGQPVEVSLLRINVILRQPKWQPQSSTQCNASMDIEETA